ncbi:MAG: hypothetical protein M0Z66_09970 [Thermaerobacter sp.]|nr:hypothetical protein [Thermaerobacter sp.]
MRSPVPLRPWTNDGWTSVTPIDLAEWRRLRATNAKPATMNLEVDALRPFYRRTWGRGWC